MLGLLVVVLLWQNTSFGCWMKMRAMATICFLACDIMEDGIF